MSKKYFISKENLKSLLYDEKNGILQINWNTGGEEKAVCGLKLRVELIDKIVSDYKSPHIPYNSDYNEPF